MTVFDLNAKQLEAVKGRLLAYPPFRKFMCDRGIPLSGTQDVYDVDVYHWFKDVDFSESEFK